MLLILSLLCCCCMCFGQQTISDTITSGGQQRNFIVYVPASYNASSPVPLLLNFHGYTSNAQQQLWYGDFRAIADTAGFIIVHPNGSLDQFGTTHFNVGWGASTVDDIGFAEDLIDSIAANYSIDLSRVYSTGMSNGGYMSFHLACNLSHKIAAVASVTGSMSNFTYSNCNPSHPTPVLQIHGTADSTVLYAGSNLGQSIDNVMAYWSNYNNCQAVGDTTSLPDINTTDGSTVSRIVYDMGDCNANTELLLIEGGGHTWAGAFINIGSTNYDIDASVEVWQFLSQYSLNSLNCFTSSTTLENEEIASIRVFPNPSDGIFSIQSDHNNETEYLLLSTLGQVLHRGQFSQYTEIDLEGYPNGLYILKIGKEIHKIRKTAP